MDVPRRFLAEKDTGHVTVTLICIDTCDRRLRLDFTAVIGTGPSAEGIFYRVTTALRRGNPPTGDRSGRGRSRGRSSAGAWPGPPPGRLRGVAPRCRASPSARATTT